MGPTNCHTQLRHRSRILAPLVLHNITYSTMEEEISNFINRPLLNREKHNKIFVS